MRFRRDSIARTWKKLSCLVSFVASLFLICDLYLNFFGKSSNFDVVPDLETMNFRVLSRTDRYEIREVEVVVVLSLTHILCF